MPHVRRPRLPAEWEPQAGVMLTWPHADGDWGDALGEITRFFRRIGVEIASRETLLNVCFSPTHAAEIREQLRHAGAPNERTLFAIAASDDSWARDHGPLTTLLGQTPVLNDFTFNGWGGRFAATKDTAITGGLSAQGTFATAKLQPRDLVLEGGAVETDGQGTLLATRRSILGSDRNPGLDITAVEHRLAEWLGIERFLWLDHGALEGDDTDSHIDTLARFVDPQTIVFVTAETDDPDFTELDQMRRQLAGFRDRKGRGYRLLPLPPAGGRHAADGRRLPASYANFLIINGAVLFPSYGCAADARARRVVEQAMPDHAIVSVDCRTPIEQNGSLHCLTMQFPAGLVLRDTAQSIPA